MEKLLIGIHGGLAMLSGREEWALDTESRIFDGKNEAEFLAQASADVARHYGGIADQKTLDWFNLIQCLAIVYGGRIYAIRSTPRARATAPQGPVAFRPGPPPSMHRTPPPTNDFASGGEKPPEGVGEIAGLGSVEFPDDHPLSPKKRLDS